MAVFPVLGSRTETALAHLTSVFSKGAVSIRVFVFALLFLAFTADARAGQITLAWDANTDPGLGGYKLYYGQTSRNYTWNIDVGNQTTYTLTGLTAGQTYYFAVTAYDSLRQNESAFSSEVQATIPISTPAPVANFTASSTTGTAPLNVAFTDASTGSVTAWNWNFGDGTSSTTQNPSHIYSAPGTYSVSLTATGPGGSNTVTKTNFITVSAPAPVANFTAGPTTGTAPLNVAFTDTSTGSVTQPTSLVAAYSFDEGNGTTVFDVSGYSNNGMINGATRTTAGKFGGGLVFNGTSGLVTIPNSASLQLTIGVTLEAWVNPSVVTSAWRDVIYKGNDNYYLEATSDNGSTPGAGGTFSSAPAYGTGALTANTWTHLAMTYDRVTVRLYVNGVQVSSRAATAAIATSTNPLQIGGDSIYGQFFQGMIDEVRVYNTALTAAQIQADMNTPVASTPALSTNSSVTAWNWNFGDGTSSTTRNPTHIYSAPGTYSVSLTATDPGGSNTVTKTNFIAVSLPAPVANFTASATTGAAPLNVTFTDASTGSVTAWNWNFGDGTSSSTRNPTHIYSAPGTYSVSLTATGPGGSNTVTKTNFIAVSLPGPVANFTASATTGTAPLNVTFTDASTGSVTAWSWNFGDGTTSTTNNPSHIYSVPGTYSVSLTATGPGGSNSVTKTNFITVSAPAPVANFTANATTGTAPLNVTFTDTSTGSVTAWSWNFGDGTTSTTNNPSHIYSVPGTYSVSLTATGPRGSNSVTKTNFITVSAPVPVANFTANATTGTAPLNVTFTDTSTSSVTAWNWNFGDGTSSTTRNPTHIYSAAGTYSVSLTATGPGGSNTATKANFITASVQNFTLTVAKTGTGNGIVTATGITCGADCSEVLPTGNVQLTAAPSAGSVFSGWSGGGCSGTTLTCTVNLAADTTVSATFSPQTFLLTVAKSGSGSGTVTTTGINCGTDCSEVLPTGNVQLTAAPSAGSMFSGWSGGGCSGTALTCTVNPAADTTVSATFSPQTFLLTVAKSGSGSGTVTTTGINCGTDCSEALPTGNVQLTAAPGAGSTFSGWSGGGCSGTTLTCTVNLTASTTVTANFQLQNQLATKIGVFRPSTGEFFLDTNGNSNWDDAVDTHITSFPHAAGDLPVVWNSDGASSIGTFNPTSGTWKLDTNGNDQWDNGVDMVVNSYGKPGDWPVTRKIAGSGSIIGTYTPALVTRVNSRRSTVKRGVWNFDLNGNSTMDACSVDECDTFASGSDNYSAERPITGDWNGTGSENIGLFVNGYWYLDVNGNEKWDGSLNGDKRFTFGGLGDIPAVGDWDGSGKTKIGVFRPSTGQWFLDLNGNGKLDACGVDACLGPFGQTGDLPVVGKW